MPSNRPVRSTQAMGDTVLVFSSDYAAASTRWAIMTHGWGGDETVWRPDVAYKGRLTQALVAADITCLSTEAGGTENWGGPASMTAMDAVYANGISRGLNTKVDLIGASMGGLAVLNWAVRHPTLVRTITTFAGTADLTASHADPAYTSEIEEIYPAPFATSRDADGGYDPALRAAEFVTAAIPGRLYQGTADTTVLPALTSAFAAAAGLTYVPLTGAGHLDLFDYVSPTEVVRWILQQP